MDKKLNKFESDVFELPVESVLIMEFPRIKAGAHFRCRLLGYKKGGSIITTVPLDGRDPLSLLDNDQCTVRYMDGQNACAFETSVLRICRDPYHYLHLYYPKIITCVQLREVYRLPIELPVKISMAGRPNVHDGTIADISPLGAGFITDTKMAKVGDIVRLDIDGGGDKRLVLDAEVRNVTGKSIDAGGDGQFRYGTRFVEVDNQQGALINDILYRQIMFHSH